MTFPRRTVEFDGDPADAATDASGHAEPRERISRAASDKRRPRLELRERPFQFQWILGLVVARDGRFTGLEIITDECEISLRLHCTAGRAVASVISDRTWKFERRGCVA